MSTHIPLMVIALKTLTLLLGGLITFLAYRAYRRTHSQSLGALAIGFAIVTLGAFLAGIGDRQFLAFDEHLGDPLLLDHAQEFGVADRCRLGQRLLIEQVV